MGRRGRLGIFREVEKWLRSRQRHPRYQHIFGGHVRRGTRTRPNPPRGTGFHHRYGGRNPPTARVRVDPKTGQEMILQRDVTGAYRARVDVLDNGTWVPKRGASTFFPDAWSPQTVDRTIGEAFATRTPLASNPSRWTGSAGGLNIMGVYDNTKRSWISAWPVL